LNKFETTKQTTKIINRMRFKEYFNFKEYVNLNLINIDQINNTFYINSLLIT